MKKILVMFLCLPVLAGAQKPLAIGDRLPDWTFKPLLNGTKEVRLSHYKNKAVVLCFWASTCGSSLTLMPRAAAWEQEFGKDLETVFVVDDNDSAAPAQVLAKRPSVAALGIPLMKKDTALLRLFPHRGGPHIILLGKDRTVKAITTMDHVGPAVLQNLVAGKSLNLPERKPGLSRAEQTTLFMDGLVENRNLLFNTLITGYIDGLPGGFAWYRLDSNRHRVLIANVPLTAMYLQAYAVDISALPTEKRKRIRVESGNRALFGGGGAAPEFCYEQVMPSSARAGFSVGLRAELDRFFNLRTGIEKRKTACWLVRPVNGKAKEGTGEEYYSQNWPGYTELKNAPLLNITATLNNTYPDKFFRVETDSMRRFTVNIKTTCVSDEELVADMKEKGFELVPVVRELDFVVIRDREPQKKKAAR